MKSHHVSHLILAFTIIALLFVSGRHADQQAFDKITVKEFELMGADGKRRASIKVESNGEVVFRMTDKAGTIRVKIGADEEGSGLVLMDGSTEPAIHALAKKDGGELTLQDKTGKKRKL